MLEVVAEEQEEFLESLNRRRMKSRGLMEGGREIEVRGSDEVRRCSFAPPPETNQPAQVSTAAYKSATFIE